MAGFNPLAPDHLGPTACMGEILAEIVATTVGAGFAEPQPLIGPYSSGAPAIFIDQCGRMGGSAAMIGAVGDDDFGRMNTDRLVRDGVDVSAIAIHSSLPTGTAFVRYQKDGCRDFVFNMWTSAAGSLSWTPAVEDVIARAGHLHVVGTSLGHDHIWQMIERAAPLIKARGGTVSLDPNQRKELMKDTDGRFAKMIAQTDLLLPSDDELFLAANGVPEMGEADAIHAIFAQGVCEIVLKRGDVGATCFQSDGTVTNAPAFIVKEVDPTGAGDCFGGAYVAARRLGISVADALTYACAAGARNVSMRGPMEGAGMRAQLNRFIADTPRGAL
jgi:fructokinase|tara:strand:+ start:1212 stop:2201 length:990 start_codon:yes stop_codon:yes gene_type:complete